MARKWLHVMLLSLIVLALLNGCSGNREGAANDTAKGNAEPDKQATEVKKVKYYHWYPDEFLQWDKLYPAFKKAHPDIEVEPVRLVENQNTDDYLKQINLLAASGDELGVIHFGYPQNYTLFAELGMVEPLDSFMENEGIKYSDVYKIDMALNGKYYGLPLQYNSRLILLNKDHLDEAGLPVPDEWTWDEFKQYAKALTAGEGASKRYGAFFGTFEFLYKIALLSNQENNNIYKADGTSNIDDPMVAKSLELRYDMENTDKSAVPYNITVSQKLDYRHQYMTGKVSMLPTGYWMISEAGGTDNFPATFTTAFAPWPKVSKDDPDGYSQSTPVALGIAKNTKNKEAAYQFLRWYTTEGKMLQANHFPAWNEADLDEVTKSLLGKMKSPEKVDAKSLTHTLSVTKGTDVIPPPYGAELDDIYKAETEKYLLEHQNLETTINNMRKNIQQVIDANKK